MPPKKGKGRKKKKQTKMAIDDVDTTTLNRSKLETFCQHVNNELMEENQYSQLLRLDRDKLVSMIAISRERLNVVRCKNREIANDIRIAEDKHRIIMEQNRQKVIHLKIESENECMYQKVISSTIISNERKHHYDMTREIFSDIDELKRQSLQVENDFHTKKIKSEKEHAEKIHVMREEDKNMHMISEAKKDKVVKETTRQLQILLSAQYSVLQSLKEKHYKMFVEMNEKNTMHLKHYYNRIVQQNKEVILLMKSNIQKVKDSLGQLDKQYSKLKKENLKLAEELKRLDQEKFALRENLSFAKKHKRELKETKDKLQSRKRLLQDIKIENFVQSMIDEKKDVAQKEEDMEQTIDQFESVSETQSIILVIELFVLHIFNKIREVNANLSEIKKIYEKRGKKNNILLGSDYDYCDTTLDSTNYQIAEITEKRINLFRTYRKILKKFNIPFENTGFKPLPFEEILTQIDNPRLLVDEESLQAHPIC